jgi:8-hydroxy-5-deazaflavin:NADPH oxidoreductase
MQMGPPALHSAFCILQSELCHYFPAMRIAIIGAGRVGMALGHGWVRAGHAVAFGVRNPAGKEVLVGRVATVPEAVRGAEVVVLATPWSAAEAALRGAGSVAGKIVVDCTNPILPGLAGLAVGTTESAAERLAAAVPDARLVKAFNTTGSANMANPSYGDHRLTMFLCGDDPAAKRAVAELIGDLGMEPVDAGALTAARYLEPLAMLWIHLAYRQGLGSDFALQLLRR